MKRKKSGFTLIEMVIVLSLTVLVLGITTTVFVTGNKVFVDSDVKTTLQMEAKDIQEKLSDICMQASDAEGITNGIKINSMGKSIGIKISSNTLYIVELDSDNTEKNGTKKVLTENLYGSPEPLKLNGNSITFNLTLQKKKGYTKAEHPINFTVTFRNI
ncbi:prepilin-type N-terminal cleavage/methylation domain-containing protein [Clostridium sp. 3-3]|uniref:PilW family protein n=1 Tax=Clostridium sp. 3-3 TaxID=2070757 RepID=UPI001FA8E63F|nr:prepilin-type N-terminal cleavage/methylation domain-containing protein [Clostridium sp. 3-3]